MTKALKRGSNGVCVLWSVTELSQKTISQSAARTAVGGGERYVFLEDDDLNTEEELPINAISQLRKETQTNNLRAT